MHDSLAVQLGILNKELYDHLANMTYRCYDKLIEEKIYGNKDSY